MSNRSSSDFLALPEPPPLPDRVDVAIVGSGYCGLAAALELARAGTRVAVLERDHLGAGASSRNGGMVGGGVKLDWHGLERRFGQAKAEALHEGARASFEHLEGLIEREQLDADYCRSGRFIAACSPTHFRALERQVRALGPSAEPSIEVVPRERQSEEIGSECYHGGVVIELSGGLHPAKFHRDLCAAAGTAGAELHGHTEVQRLTRTPQGFRLTTNRGELQTAEVFVATNGYTGPVTPDLSRRVVPVASYMIATEELPPDLARQLSPRGRMFVDSNRLLAYFRLSPDGKRVLLGGRINLRDTNEPLAARALHRKLLQIWPALAPFRLTHAWKGYLGFTFDHLPHMGMRDGVHFAMGCNGSGVAMATYLGHQTALKLLHKQNRPCPFDSSSFPGHPLYSGRPWFLPLVGAWYRLRDTLDHWRP